MENLRKRITAAKERSGLSMGALTVLSPKVDPYRIDTPARHRDGAWVAQQLNNLLGPDRRIHWRGLHYAIVAHGGIIRPDGTPYVNDENCWIWFSEIAAKAARWLGYVPFDRIVDNRNEEIIIHRRPEETPVTFVDSGAISFALPDVAVAAPTIEIRAFSGRQPFGLVIFGEKASLEDVLLPLAERYEADLILGTGEASDTRIWEIARDAVADGRPMAVFTVTDCDPSGVQMTTSIARKLQAFKDAFFPDLQFEIIPAALTVEQVKDLGLPSTPLKATERRAGRWIEAHGVEQTEVDAIATLNPAALRKIVTDAIVPYFDETLDRRSAYERRQWEYSAQSVVASVVDEDEIASLQERLQSVFDRAREEVAEINNRLREIAEQIPELEPPDLPEAELKGDRQPLISSEWPWEKATLALVARKKYEAENQSKDEE